MSRETRKSIWYTLFFCDNIMNYYHCYHCKHCWSNTELVIWDVMALMWRHCNVLSHLWHRPIVHMSLLYIGICTSMWYRDGLQCNCLKKDNSLIYVDVCWIEHVVYGDKKKQHQYNFIRIKSVFILLPFFSLLQNGKKNFYSQNA